MSNLARIHSSQQQELTTTDSEPNIAPDLVTELREEPVLSVIALQIMRGDSIIPSIRLSVLRLQKLI